VNHYYDVTSNITEIAPLYNLTGCIPPGCDILHILSFHQQRLPDYPQFTQRCWFLKNTKLKNSHSLERLKKI